MLIDVEKVSYWSEAVALNWKTNQIHIYIVELIAIVTNDHNDGCISCSSESDFYYSITMVNI